MELKLSVELDKPVGIRSFVNVTFTDDDLLEFAKRYVADAFSDRTAVSVNVEAIVP